MLHSNDAIAPSCSGFILALIETASSILFCWTIGGNEAIESYTGHNSWFGLPLAVVSALRVYAISGRAIELPIAILLLSLVFTSYDFV